MCASNLLWSNAPKLVGVFLGCGSVVAVPRDFFGFVAGLDHQRVDVVVVSHKPVAAERTPRPLLNPSALRLALLGDANHTRRPGLAMG